jgi:hypothetical protein
MKNLRAILVFTTTALLAAFVPSIAAPPDVKSAKAPAQPKDATQARVDAALARLVGAGHDWRTRQNAADALAAIGNPSIEAICATAVSHTDRDVREKCYELLTEKFLSDDRASQTVMKSGLRDTDRGIRYLCAFRLGEHKVAGAVEPLRQVIDTNNDGKPKDMWPLYAAAKSLAELGRSDGLPLLYHALGSDFYMERYMAHQGFQAISGKSPDDFNGYQFGEGAAVVSGMELFGEIQSVEDAENKARRFLAIAAYCKWLRTNRPELARVIDHPLFATP